MGHSVLYVTNVNLMKLHQCLGFTWKAMRWPEETSKLWKRGPEKNGSGEQCPAWL